MLSFLRNSKLAAKFTLVIFSFSLVGAMPSPLPAQENYPSVGRLSFISGPVTYSRGDDPDQWDDAVENLPLSIGDRIYAPEDGRAEVQLSSGNFVRLAPRSYLSALNLSDDVKQFYLGEGAASFNIRRLPSDELFEIDTPNVSVTFEEAGRYRVAVDDDGNTRVIVRRGRATLAASGRQIAVENSEVRVYGIDSPRYEIVGLPPVDAFDRWVSEREDRFERAYSDAYRHASDDILGVEDLAEYGRWEEIPDYGYAWTPTRVAAGWLPFSSGRWYWQDPWGWTWISNDRWGWATSHYGRWMPYRSRWYWVPVRPRTRVRYAPACVEFVRVRDHVGWFPLHPRDRHFPWWERRDRRFDRNATYVNHTYVTVVNRNTFVTARPVNKYIVRDSVIIRDARSARFTEDLPIPNRSSLRIISENGGGRRHKPAANILSRTAVVRTAVPNPPRAFQEKLPEIQKSQGRPIEPARMLASANSDRGMARVRVRPAVEARGGDFAPRNSASGGPALQPVTQARGKKLATRETTGNDASEKAVSAQKVPAVQAPQSEPGTGTAGRSELRREENRDRQQNKQAADRALQTQELERQKQAQQKDEEGKAQLQKQQQEKERQQAQERQSREQKQKAIEARQPQQKAAEHNAQAQKQQAQERQEQRSREQRRLEELEQAQQREEQRKLQAQQNRQEQERREQLRQQQERQAQQQKQQELNRREEAQQQQEQQLRQQQAAQERQAREQQRQQELERRQQQQQREQERNIQLQPRQEQVREQQLRQQRAQAQREAQEAQRQQEQERRSQPRQPQLPDRFLQQPQKQ